MTSAEQRYQAEMERILYNYPLGKRLQAAMSTFATYEKRSDGWYLVKNDVPEVLTTRALARMYPVDE